METPLLKLRAAALASALAWAGIVPAAAAPTFIPYAPNVQSDVVEVVENSVTIIRRERRHRDGGRDMRRHRRESREHARRHDDGARQFRPRATRKYAYDADGNYRVYDGNGWEDKGRGKGRDRRRNWHRWNDWNDWNAGTTRSVPASTDFAASALGKLYPRRR